MWYLAVQDLFAQSSGNDGDLILPIIIPSPPSVVDPFPRFSSRFVISNDSATTYKGLLRYNYGQKKTEIVLTRDWSVITISEYVNGERLKIPYTSTVDWYLSMMRQQKWHQKFFDIMNSTQKSQNRRGRGQMLEVVGLDIGRLGRASLQVSGNVNINGKMVFQDQELVRSTLNETQNTHLEFDQKQNLNIKGKIGDRITVAMDQDSERQFEWENNIRISYDGYEDDIVQKVEAGNISLSLPQQNMLLFLEKIRGCLVLKPFQNSDLSMLQQLPLSKNQKRSSRNGKVVVRAISNK